jgi:cation diffusion facilitator family transporter
MSPAGQRALVLLSILAAVITIALKALAYSLTQSVGLLSDALESGINLIAAFTAYLSLHYSHRPADAEHTYGHEKIEFFSAGLEGALIVVAGIGTGWVAVEHLSAMHPLTDLGIGIGISLGSSVVNLAVGIVLVRVGRRENSIVLEADGRHLLVDVWTSVGIAAGLTAVWASGVYWLDPVIAMLVGANIIWTGLRLVRRSFNGLMDHALDTPQLEALRAAIRTSLPPGTDFHALRTRQAGASKFADFHLLVPGAMSVREAHEVAERVEAALAAALPRVGVTIHIEPIEEKASWEDHALRGIEPPGVQPGP